MGWWNKIVVLKIDANKKKRQTFGCECLPFLCFMF